MLRIAADGAVCNGLVANPVAFAAWYATAGELIDWPPEVRALQAAERARRLSLERMMKLLQQVNYVLAGRLSADHARRVLEGYALHEWLTGHAASFQRLARERLELLERVSHALDDAGHSTFADRVSELSSALGLTSLEHDILSFAVTAAISDEVSGLFEQLAANRWSAERLWQVAFGTSREALARALRADSPLRLSRLLRPADGRQQLALVSMFWVELLVRAESLVEAVLEPLPARAGAGMPARLSAEDERLATSVLARAAEPGVNLMLYGAASLEKRSLVQALADGAGRRAWRVREFDALSRHDAPTLAYVAFRLLAQRHDPAVLVLERPTDVLSATPPEFLRTLFGIDLSEVRPQPFDEHLLATNDVPGLWLMGDPRNLPDDTVARFVFHAPLKKADKAQRAEELRRRIEGLRLTKAAARDILTLEGVSGAQLEAALKAARLTVSGSRRARDAALVQAVRRSQRALGRGLQARERVPVTQYSLKYLNTAGRFGPAQILQCLRTTPRAAMVFYGPPGTGKTQFVEHLAAELGMPLVAKRASELLSKWVGESEKNIAQAFEEAASEDALLLLDEGDSFLRDRSQARASWEVTQVNELLQHIERFEGIVVVCTNLFRGLDAAALRRFTFKVEFRALDAHQRWEMFVNEAGLRGRLGEFERATREDWESRLMLMAQLTAGDFATVKRQCLLLGTQLNPDEWLTQLQLECDVKASGGDTRELV
jgi:hypothetical protein